VCVWGGGGVSSFFLLDGHIKILSPCVYIEPAPLLLRRKQSPIIVYASKVVVQDWNVKTKISQMGTTMQLITSPAFYFMTSVLCMPFPGPVYSTRWELNSYSAPTAEHHHISGMEKLQCYHEKVVKSGAVCTFNVYLTLDPLVWSGCGLFNAVWLSRTLIEHWLTSKKGAMCVSLCVVCISTSRVMMEICEWSIKWNL